jgi:hypothetical protein
MNFQFEFKKYMTLLSLSFIIQFVIAVVCLAVISMNSEASLLSVAWYKLSFDTKKEIQIRNNCCGFNSTQIDNQSEPPCPTNANKPCLSFIQESVAKALKVSGAIALTFSFINVRLCFKIYLFSLIS